jgi:hypothetical protein
MRVRVCGKLDVLDRYSVYLLYFLKKSTQVVDAEGAARILPKLQAAGHRVLILLYLLYL